MTLAGVDYTIIALFGVILLMIGTRSGYRTAQNLEQYFLGGRAIPWYFLGLSDASDMFDISGTMWLVTIGFVYGMKSVWLPWLWPTFNQIFLMVYLSAWVRRTGAKTGEDWLRIRFGNDRGAVLSQLVIVVFVVIRSLCFLAYGFVGLGKFVEAFVPWTSIQPYLGIQVPPSYAPDIYGGLITFAAMIYTLRGGMKRIVTADAFFYAIRAIACVAVAFTAMRALAGQTLHVPDGWLSVGFGQNLGLDWRKLIPEANRKIAEDQFSNFPLIVFLMLFKGLPSSAAGPEPSYDMQKILASRSPREAALVSAMVNVVLFPLRYLMVFGFVALAVMHYYQLNLGSGAGVDFEKLLPAIIARFVGAGWRGVAIVGLASGFISTFDSTVNTAQAYLANGIYLKYVNPRPSGKQFGRVNFLTGVVLVLGGMAMGLWFESIDTLLQWLVSGLYGGYIGSNILKWYWWRCNGYGYFWGMAAGMCAAIGLPALMPGVLPLRWFPLILIVSVACCITGSLLTEPADIKTVEAFYRGVKPWGLWGPIHRALAGEGLRKNRMFWRDMFNIAVGIAWQTAVVALAGYFVLRQWGGVAGAASVVISATLLLKVYWFDKLEA